MHEMQKYTCYFNHCLASELQSTDMAENMYMGITCMTGEWTGVVERTMECLAGGTIVFYRFFHPYLSDLKESPLSEARLLATECFHGSLLSKVFVDTQVANINIGNLQKSQDSLPSLTVHICRCPQFANWQIVLCSY